MEAAGMACVALFIPCLVVLAVTLITSGSIASIAAHKSARPVRVIAAVALVAGVAVAIYVGPAFFTKEMELSVRPSYAFHDPRINDYVAAVATLDRQSVGLPLIPPDAEVRIIDDGEGYAGCPDIEVYIPLLPFRRHSVCLERTIDGYAWSMDLVQYLGPRPWESMYFFYSSRPLDYAGWVVQPYEISINYSGSSDTRLEGRVLTLDYVQPFLDEWEDFHRQSSSP